MIDFRQVDEVILGENDAHVVARAGELSRQSDDDLSETSRFGEGGKFSCQVHDPHDCSI